jgi:hypothetical protein
MVKVGFKSTHKNQHSSRAITNVATGGGNKKFGGDNVVGKEWNTMRFRSTVDPTNLVMKCCKGNQLSIPIDFATGYRRPSYPTMRMFAP